MLSSLESNIALFKERALCYNDILADNPELSGEEHASSRLGAELLRDAGFEVEYPFCGLSTAYRAVKGNGGTRVALLVEYDALPEIGHGCGHCASGAMSLLAGMAIADLLPQGCELQVIGTPDEEVGGGKIVMAEKGVFDECNLALMIHLAPSTEVWPTFLTLSTLLMEFSGVEAHASAAPWEGRNALNAAQLTAHAIDMMRQHIRPGMRVHGIYREAGTASNIVPGRASLLYDVRGEEVCDVLDLESWVKDAAHGCAMATRTEVVISHPTPTLWGLKDNPALRRMVGDVFKRVGVSESGPEIQRFRASSDIGHVAAVCPTAHPMLGGLGGELHSRELAGKMKSPQAHELIVTGARILGVAALEAMNSSDLLRDMKLAFAS